MIYVRSRALIASAFVLGCIFTITLSQQNTDQKTVGAKNGISINDVKEYRKMLRVNEKPIDMVAETARLCAAPEMLIGPHHDPGVVYYINEIARQGLKTYLEKKQFPVGSIIVKEKQERRTEDSVQIITVMKKARGGSGEDTWDYKMYDVSKWVELDPYKQKIPFLNYGCISCHRRYKNNDYVSQKGIELMLGKSQSKN
jgi:Cytochrome P460